MIGRRGVAQGAFSPKELRELLNLPGVRVTVDPEELELGPEDEVDLAAQRPRRRAYEAIVKAIASPPATGAASGEALDAERELVLKFLRSPAAFLPAAAASSGERVGAVRLSVNTLEGPSGRRRAVSTDASETTSGVTLVLRSVGYRALPVAADPDAAHPVPFDPDRGVVPSRFGRVQGGAGQVKGLYVCGWLKRGPTGIIGTNLQCAEETVEALVADDRAGNLAVPDPGLGGEGVGRLLLEREVVVVDAEGWRRIDAAERRAGEKQGKPREKLVDVEEMVRIASSPNLE